MLFVVADESLQSYSKEEITSPTINILFRSNADLAFSINNVRQ
jgi:hypothetical protein